ncbi:MAG: hypothetical protein GX590_01760 [Lentisphaerae bacterium]|nr:hypothetical protein [Lentisphaerota bacterium]
MSARSRRASACSTAASAATTARARPTAEGGTGNLVRSLGRPVEAGTAPALPGADNRSRIRNTCRSSAARWLVRVYAVGRRDPILILGQAFGLLVYARNLMLIHAG